MKQFLAVLLVLCLALPVFAQEVDFIAVTSVTTTCTAPSTISIGLDSFFRATVEDISIPGDYSYLVLYDALGTAIGGKDFLDVFQFSHAITSTSINITTAPAARPFTLAIYDTVSPASIPVAVTYPQIDSITFDPADFGACTFLPELVPTSGASDDDTVPHFTDGRINNFDMAAPFVVFGRDFEDGRGLVVYSPEGALLLTVTPDEIGECSGETIELASDNGVTLYLLPSCEYQMMAASLDGTKNYILIFNEPYPNTGYSSYEE